MSMDVEDFKLILLLIDDWQEFEDSGKLTDQNVEDILELKERIEALLK